MRIGQELLRDSDSGVGEGFQKSARPSNMVSVGVGKENQIYGVGAQLLQIGKDNPLTGVEGWRLRSVVNQDRRSPGLKDRAIALSDRQECKPSRTRAGAIAKGRANCDAAKPGSNQFKRDEGEASK